MGDKARGLYNKFVVQRTDGKSEPGQKHDECEYFVLDVTHDPHAKAALLAYAESCKAEKPGGYARNWWKENRAKIPWRRGRRRDGFAARKAR